MEKQALTNLGIATLIADRYVLSNADLQFENRDITINFELLVLHRIQMNLEQQEYLYNLPQDLKYSLQQNLIERLTQRFPIVFTKAIDEKKSKEGRSKLIGVKRENSSSYLSLLGDIIDEIQCVSICYTN